MNEKGPVACFSESWIALQNLVSKECFRFLRMWIQTLMPPVVTTILYCLVFGKILGASVGPIQGHSYLSFIFPGLLVMVLINNSFSNVASSFVNAKIHRSLEDLLVAPLSPHLIIIGFSLGGMLRSLLIASLLLLLYPFFSTTWLLFQPLYLILFLFLTSILFSLVGLITAMKSINYDEISVFPNFILTPLTYLGGVFYPISHLEGIWKKLTVYNPIAYIVDGVRYACIGSSEFGMASICVVMSCFIVFLYLWALFLLQDYERLNL